MVGAVTPVRICIQKRCACLPATDEFIRVNRDRKIRTEIEMPPRRIVCDPSLLAAEAPQRSYNLGVGFPAGRRARQRHLPEQHGQVKRMVESEGGYCSGRVVAERAGSLQQIATVSPNSVGQVEAHNHRKVMGGGTWNRDICYYTVFGTWRASCA